MRQQLEQLQAQIEAMKANETLLEIVNANITSADARKAYHVLVAQVSLVS